MALSLFVHSSANGDLSSLHALAFVNDSVMNLRIQVLVSVPVFSSFGYEPWDEISESHGPVLTPVLSCVCFFPQHRQAVF